MILVKTQPAQRKRDRDRQTDRQLLLGYIRLAQHQLRYLVKISHSYRLQRGTFLSPPCIHSASAQRSSACRPTTFGVFKRALWLYTHDIPSSAV